MYFVFHPDLICSFKNLEGITIFVMHPLTIKEVLILKAHPNSWTKENTAVQRDHS